METKWLERLQQVVQRDEGGRGMKALVTGPNELEGTARALLQVILPRRSSTLAPPHVIVLTGFPCLVDREPPCETDGPPGAAAIARALFSLGCRVTLPIEKHSACVLDKCVKACFVNDNGRMANFPKDGSATQMSVPALVDNRGLPLPQVVSFPVGRDWDAAAEARLMELVNDKDMVAVVCIERAGEAKNRICHTMRGIPMGKDLLAPRINEELLGFLSETKHSAISIAIGDGGNELGLGASHDATVESVPLGATIGCVVRADSALVASVSNWGGYALVCALALLKWTSLTQDDITEDQHLDMLVPDANAAEMTLCACNHGGAVDGISRQAGCSVDGMPLAQQLSVLEELRALTLSFLQEHPRTCIQHDKPTAQTRS